MKNVLIACVLLCAGIGPAWAQAKPAETDPNALLNAAAQVAQAVDREQTGALWDGASAITRKRVTRNDFIAAVQKARKPLGTVSGRAWAAVRRQSVASGGQVPAGQYASVELTTTFSSRKVARELVSFRLDEDGVWRLAGYVLE